jgi:hypothetical protein
MCSGTDSKSEGRAEGNEDTIEARSPSIRVADRAANVGMGRTRCDRANILGDFRYSFCVVALYVCLQTASSDTAILR